MSSIANRRIIAALGGIPGLDTLIKTVTGKVESWLNALVAMLPNLGLAMVVMLLFWVLARYLSRGVARLLHRVARNQEIVDLLCGILRVTVLGTGFSVALSILRLDRAVTSLLAGVGILGLALGFAFQDIASNFFSGVIMAIRRPFRVGDVVEIHGYFGKVERIDLRATRLAVPEGQVVTLPNRKVLENPIVNFTEFGARRVDVEVGVTYGADLEQAAAVADRAIAGLELRQEHRKIEIYFTGFGESSIDLVARFWIGSGESADYFAARAAAVQAIKAAFDEAGIIIPFPIRTLDFSAVGGEQLSAMLHGDEASPTPSHPNKRVSSRPPADTARS